MWATSERVESNPNIQYAFPASIYFFQQLAVRYTPAMGWSCCVNCTLAVKVSHTAISNRNASDVAHTSELMTAVPPATGVTVPKRPCPGAWVWMDDQVMSLG